MDFKVNSSGEINPNSEGAKSAHTVDRASAHKRKAL